MPICCKAEEFGLSCGGDIFDHEGNYYCLFHLPCDSPHKTGFNGLMFERIDQAINDNDLCDLSGVQFPGEIDFRRYDKDNPLPDIDFDSAFFDGFANFKSVVFSGTTVFKATSFNGGASFTSASFNQSVTFESATFTGDAFFKQADFNGDADFKSVSFSVKSDFNSATFSEYAIFSSATFNENAEFEHTTFKKPAVFSSASFVKKALFYSASFADKVDFSSVSFRGSASFRAVTFGRYADFESVSVSGNTDFRGAIFNGNAYIKSAKFNGTTLFNGAQFANIFFLIDSKLIGNIFFRHTKFEQTAVFNATSLAETEFTHCHFQKPAYFKRTEFGKVSFDSCMVEARLEFDQAKLLRAQFDGAPLEDFRFIDCEWPLYKVRKIIYDPWLDGFLGDVKVAEETKTGKLQDIFRRLKKIAKAENDEALAGDWHYWEKEMQRLASGPASGALLWIYKQLSGYGESWLRAWVVLLMLISIPIVVYHLSHWLLGSWPESFSPGWGMLRWVNSWLVGRWSDWLPFVKVSNANNDPLWEAINGLYRILITGQAALFLLALRNKMRR